MSKTFRSCVLFSVSVVLSIHCYRLSQRLRELLQSLDVLQMLSSALEFLMRAINKSDVAFMYVHSVLRNRVIWVHIREASHPVNESFIDILHTFRLMISSKETSCAGRQSCAEA